MKENAGEGNSTPLSLPLYAGGLAVTLAGVLAVGIADATSGSGDSTVTTVAVLLTVMGFAFSLGCRSWNVHSRWIESACLAFLACVAYRLFHGGLDTAWFVGGANSNDMRLAMGLMWVSVLRSWTLVSDGTVMFACVLTAAMIGLIGTQDVNTITVVLFGVFVLAMVFLLIHQNYLQNRALASARERSRGFVFLLPTQIGLTLLCGVFVLGLGSALIVPAQMAFKNVSLAKAIRGLVAGTGQGPSAATPLTEPFVSDDAHLPVGSGAAWPTSSDVLLFVTPSDGQPHYWRGRTYDLYLGSGWQSTQTVSTFAASRGASDAGHLYALSPRSIRGEGCVAADGCVADAGAPRASLVTTFDVRGVTDQFYYADEPHSIRVDADATGTPRLALDGRLDSDGHPVTASYMVSSTPAPDWSQPDVQARLRRDGTNYPPEVVGPYLGDLTNAQNNVTIPKDVLLLRRALADALKNLPPNRRTPFDKAVAIRDWVANRCVYSLAVEAMPADVDHVSDFLFNTRKGYCDLFASSMVVLCRLAGIPARVATGFAPGDREGFGYNLRAMDKHAWVEVYFPNDRWQIFDPTIGTRTDGTLPMRNKDAGGFWKNLQRALTSQGPVPVLLAGLILVLLAYVAITEAGDRRKRDRPARGPASLTGDSEYALLTRTLARLGLPRRFWETPLEYEARAVAFLTAQEAALGASLHPETVHAVTAHFLTSRYGAAPPESADPIRPLLAEFVRAAARARFRRFFRRFRPSRRASSATFPSEAM